MGKTAVLKLRLMIAQFKYAWTIKKRMLFLNDGQHHCHLCDSFTALKNIGVLWTKTDGGYIYLPAEPVVCQYCSATSYVIHLWRADSGVGMLLSRGVEEYTNRMKERENV
jgi:hypothetical protein